MTEQLHKQGGTKHLTDNEKIIATSAATDSNNGLLPGGAVIDGVRYSIPLEYNRNGIKGMMAFDTDFLYICTNINTWRRLPLIDWLPFK